MILEDLGTVFVAEFTRRIKSRPYLIGLAIGIGSIMLFTKLPALLGNAFSGPTTIVLVGDSALTKRAEPLLENDYKIAAVLPAQPITPALISSYKAAASFSVTANKSGLRVVVYTHDPGSMGAHTIRRALLPLQLSFATGTPPTRVKALTEFPVDVRVVASKFTSANQAQAVRAVAYTLIFFLYLLILLNSQLVTSAVAEEKTSRIAELLVASVDPVALLGGKILAGAALAVLQMAIWISSATLGTPPAGAAAHGDAIFSLANMFTIVTPALLVAFFMFFLIGFFQLSTLFAALASLINRTEDLGAITGPLAIPVMAAFFIAVAALGSPDRSWVVAASFVPVLSPFVMFARIAVSNVPLWQTLTALLINILALYLIALFAGKVYRVGMLLYGRTPKLRQVWGVIRS